MKESNCSYEEEVRKSTLEGHWSQTVRDHLRSCRGCEDLSLVLSGMQNLAAQPEQRPALPDPYLIWLKAEFLARQAHLDQRSKPFVLIEWLAQAAAPAALALFLLWKWSAVEAALSRWFYTSDPAGLLDGWTIATNLLSFSSPVVAWTLAAVFSFVLLLLLEPLWAD